MLRINLLPAYIAERQKVRNAIFGSVALFLAVVGSLLAWQFMFLQKALDTRTQEATDMEAKATQEQSFEAQTATIRTQVKPLQEKVGFVENLRFYNTLRPRIFRNAAAYTYKQVEYNQMSVTGNTLAVNGYVKNIADIGRFYITFYGNPDVTAVSVSGIPSWPQSITQANGTSNEQGVAPGQNVIPERLRSFPVALTATLAKPVTPPVLPASLQQGAGGAGATPGAPAPAVAAPVPGAPAADTPPPGG